MCSEAAIQISHVTSSSPSTFAEPEPGARQPPEHERSQRRGQQAHHLDHARRARAQRASRPGRVPWSPMSLYDLVASLPLTHRGLRARRPRPHGLLRLRAQDHGDRRCTAAASEGRGEDVTYEAGGPRRPAGRRAGARAGGRVHVRLLLRAPRDARHSSRATRPSRRLPPLPALGLRVRGARPRAAPGRHVAARAARPHGRAGHVRRLLADGRAADDRPGHAPARRLPGAALQARRDAGLDRRADRRSCRQTGAVDSIDFKGAYKGTVVDVETDPAFYRRIAEAFPDAWLEDPDLETEEARHALAAAPGPDHLGRADPRRRGHPRRAGDAAHGQPQAVALRLA